MCDCKIDWLWVRSLLEEIQYLFKFIIPFLLSGVEAKRGVEFRHSTCNAFRIRQKYQSPFDLIQNKLWTKIKLKT